MNNYIYFGGGLVIGGVIGAFLMKKLVEKTYSEHAKKQIDEVVSYYRSRTVKPEKKEDPVTQKKTEKPKEEKPSHIPAKEHKPSENEFDTEMKVISIDEYNYIPGYTQETLVMYGDGVMTDDADIPMSDTEVEELFGPDILDRINNCGDSSIYVRDPMEMIDYEIVMCPTEFNG